MNFDPTIFKIRTNMKKIQTLFAITFISVNVMLIPLEGFTQINQEIVRKPGLLLLYQQGDKTLTPRKLNKMFKMDENMRDHYIAIKQAWIATCVSESLSILIPIGFFAAITSLGDFDPTGMFIIGTLGMCAAIPLAINWHVQINKAIRYYNSGYKSSEITISLGAGPGGVGIVIRF